MFQDSTSKDTMSVRDEIARFSSYFSCKIDEVEKVDSSFFRKVLYMGIVDTLSRAGFPNTKEQRKRWVKFIDECSSWEDRDRVSAQQLMLNLEKEKKINGNLYKLVKKTVDSWPEGSIIDPQSDLTSDEANIAAGKGERNLVKDATYKHLFYTYRNNLVHEFREPGYGIESSEKNPTPYYHGMIGEPWQLVFTDVFIKRVCAGCLCGLVTLLHSQQRNPYESFEFGSSWGRQ